MGNRSSYSVDGIVPENQNTPGGRQLCSTRFSSSTCFLITNRTWYLRNSSSYAYFFLYFSLFLFPDAASAPRRFFLSHFTDKWKVAVNTNFSGQFRRKSWGFQIRASFFRKHEKEQGRKSTPLNCPVWIKMPPNGKNKSVKFHFFYARYQPHVSRRCQHFKHVQTD